MDIDGFSVIVATSLTVVPPAGDRIVKVNGESIIGRTYSQVIALIQNRYGTWAHLESTSPCWPPLQTGPTGPVTLDSVRLVLFQHLHTTERLHSTCWFEVQRISENICKSQ